MKRTIFVSMLLASLMAFQIIAEDYPLVKLAEYTNSTIVIRPRNEVEPQDDMTGNNLSIDSDGIIHVYNIDTGNLYNINKDYSVFVRIKLPFSKITSYITWYKQSYSVVGIFGNIYGYNLEGELQYLVKARQLPSKDSSQVYYDEQCDVLFFRDEKSNLYSIEHPSMDEAENKANFKGPTETIEMLNSGKYAPHLTTKNNSLWIDGLSYYWPGKKINKICYQYVDESSITIFVPDNTVRFDFRSPNEQIESIEIHPCGDIYVLRMNWNTNTHILYRVENTWDPEWRASWYAKHPDAPGKVLPSGNGVQAAATTVRTGYLNDDRIRLRKGPGTSTESLGTYPVNTTFTIIEDSGVKQTIDGVTDEWIKVRLSDGTEGYFYGQYVSEK